MFARSATRSGLSHERLQSADGDARVAADVTRASALECTIVRPGALLNGPKTGRYRVLTDPQAWRNGLIRRADVADFMVGAAASGDHAAQAPVLISRGFWPFT